MSEVADTGEQTSSPEERLISYFKGEAPPKQTKAPERVVEASQPEPQSDEQEATDEPTVDDLEDDAPQESTPDADSLEIQYNGQPLKLTKDEAKERAQLGEHFKRNQERFEQTWQQANALAQQAQQLVQAAPQIKQAEAMVMLYENALSQFDANQMRHLASTDPAAYLEKRAEYDTLAMQHQQAHQQYQQVVQQYNGGQQNLRQAALAQEFEMLPKLVPQWRDQTRFAADRKALQEKLSDWKVRPQTLDAIQNNAELLTMAHKAARYDALQAGKRDKMAQADKAPQVVKPGSSNNAIGQGNTDRVKKAQSNLKKTGSADAFANLLIAKGFK